MPGFDLDKFSFQEHVLTPWKQYVGYPMGEALQTALHFNLEPHCGIDIAAKKLGIEIIYTKDKRFKNKGASTIHCGEKIILLPKKDSYFSQKYTIAHEIGHHILHISKGISAEDQKAEIEADLFAIVLLLRTEPHENVLEFLKHNFEARLYPYMVFWGTLIFFAGGGILKLFSLIAKERQEAGTKQTPLKTFPFTQPSQIASKRNELAHVFSR